MPAAASGVRIAGLTELRNDLRRALGAYPKALAAGIKRAGAPLAPRASGYAPVGRSDQGGQSGRAYPAGALRAGYRLSVRGSTGSVVNPVPYAAGAEWGLHGKWAGFTRYPSAGTGGGRGRGRFAYRAVFESEAEIVDAIDKELNDVLTVYGWFR